MFKTTPWHQVVALKDELMTGELTLSQFAADLHDVVSKAGRRPLYEEADRFFALTYATLPLRDLARDVAARLAGKSDKAVRQLEMTYGGGKTHTLITLHHLFHNPETLPEVKTVQEFRKHAGVELPAATTAALCFDKIDVEKGLKAVRGPGGQRRTLHYPWNILAFQLAGEEGLRILHGDNFALKDRAGERDTAPAEPLLVELLEAQQRSDGRATLILLDEVMMYARTLAARHAVLELQNFFQTLTQAAAKVDRAAIVASLLATDPSKTEDEIGKKVLGKLENVFSRQSEPVTQPVPKEDVAEVMRRRFFNPSSIEDPAAFRASVIAVVNGIAKVDDATSEDQARTERKFQASFPFHPDLTDVFYTRWTHIEGFQRTRGILRTLAIALRDAKELSDPSPIAGVSVLLGDSNGRSVSEAVRELAKIATKDVVRGNATSWQPLLEKELEIARQIQVEFPSLAAFRVMEQAVLAVFLHSQPVGHKAQTSELRRLIGASGPDAITLEKGLRRWRDASWFLDDADPQGYDRLPESWRLGNAPNLRQMHDQACKDRVTQEAAADRLKNEIRSTGALWRGSRNSGAFLHKLPRKTRDVPDDGNFRYVILGPRAASTPADISKVATEFLDFKATAPQKAPRVYRNALVLAVPSAEGTNAALSATRSLLGWEHVKAQLSRQTIDPIRLARLNRNLDQAKRFLPGTIRAAYEVVVTVGDDNKVQAQRLQGSDRPLFEVIQKDEGIRIVDKQINPEALGPAGPFGLWEEGDDARLASHLMDAFARDPRLPKVLKQELVKNTVIECVRGGIFVARLKRPDGSARTWWMEEVGNDVAVDEEPELEVVLPSKIELERLNPSLLGPGRLPDLWKEGPDGSFRPLPVRSLLGYFSGDRTAVIPRDGYDDELPIPACADKTVFRAVEIAVRDGTVWITNRPATAWKEPIPPGALNQEAMLRPPPAQIDSAQLTEEQAPAAWSNGETTGLKLTQFLSQSQSPELPWGAVREGIRNAISSGWLQLAGGSGPVDCDFSGAARVALKKPERFGPNPDPARLESSQVIELAGQMPSLLRAADGAELRFEVSVCGTEKIADDVRAKIEKVLGRISPDLQVLPGNPTGSV